MNTQILSHLKYPFMEQAIKSKTTKRAKIKNIVAPFTSLTQDLIPSNVRLTPLTYRGGHLLTNVEVYTIFWGKDWTTATKNAMITPLNQFFKNIVGSSLIDQLTEYNVPNQKIGHGSFVGTLTTNTPSLAKTVSNITIQNNLKKWIATGIIPPITPNRLYFVFTQSGTVVKDGIDASCQVFCGFHDVIPNSNIFYAVIPFPDCSGCLGGLSVMDSLTLTASHELCEAITDPVPGEGWYNDTYGEIGDYPCRHAKTVLNYKVQTAFSNKVNTCV
jgi:hypothetical protein